MSTLDDDGSVKLVYISFNLVGNNLELLEKNLRISANSAHRAVYRRVPTTALVLWFHIPVSRCKKGVRNLKKARSRMKLLLVIVLDFMIHPLYQRSVTLCSSPLTFARLVDYDFVSFWAFHIHQDAPCSMFDPWNQCSEAFINGQDIVKSKVCS